ncbi:MAG: Ti-type conjugative transfer relaxase TraA [Gammaproteobacteria bacterium]|nr:Ti-type conjugative transfer relaxase TraA [Gammaproteobacteria bacterium]
MAIYYFDVSVISRTRGRSAIASAAYRRAAKMLDEKAGRTWNYENKPGVVHSEISVPQNSLHSIPWVKRLVELQRDSRQSGNLASQHLWNLVEQTENRIDAQLSREVKFALPIELTQEQNISLAREFIENQFAAKGMIADWNVHYDNPENPHVHVMLTMREATSTGLGKKVRSWNGKDLNLEWRQKWSEYANFHLKLYHHNIRIDHRSYKDQGIDLVPTIHLGPAVKEMERRGIRTALKKEADSIKAENLKKILKTPELLAQKIFQKIERHESVFSEGDLVGEILAYTKDKTEFDSAIEKIKKSKDLIYLGVGEDGNARYTTRRMFDIENNVQQIADKLQTKNHIRISDRKIRKAIERYQTKIGKRLTPEQREAVEHMVYQNTIACVVGKAGTGKSFTLGAANAVWKAKGLNVYGIALAGVAARNLAKESEINSRTIESFRFCVENEIITLTSRDVIVMDEAGMTDSVAMESVLKAVKKANAKLALVGDYAQLQPVGPGAAFRAIIERLNIKPKVLKEVYRQKHDWQKKATTHFSEGEIKEGIDLYHEKGFIHIENNETQVKQKLVDDWDGVRKLQSLIKPEALKDYLVLAHRNMDVDELNLLIRRKRVENQEIGEGCSVLTNKGKINISQGDRILIRENNHELGIKNGQFAEIKHVDFNESGKVISFAIQLDSDKSKSIIINPKYYKSFTYGYAATVHKSQGASVEHGFVYLGGRWWNRNLTYVAMTRHKESCHIYSDKSIHRNLESLKANISRKSRKDSVLDYPLGFNERRGIDTESLLQKLPEYITEKLKQVRDKITAKFTQVGIPVKSEIHVEIKKPESLTDVLKRYVEYELKQTELVNLSHSTRRASLEESRKYSILATDNNNKMEKFAKEVIHYPAIKVELDKIKNNRLPKIYEVGGFKAIQDRLNKNELTPQDVSILLSQLKSKALVYDYAVVQKQQLEEGRHQERGGRRA